MHQFLIQDLGAGIRSKGPLVIATRFSARRAADAVGHGRIGPPGNHASCSSIGTGVLRSIVNFAHQGKVRHRHIAEQASQALCISLVVNCIAAYNASLLPTAIEDLRTQGNTVNDDDISYLGPTMTENLNVHGRYRFDLTNVGF